MPDIGFVCPSDLLHLGLDDRVLTDLDDDRPRPEGHGLVSRPRPEGHDLVSAPHPGVTGS